jgi:TetR/AcrR family transcriptional repressor of lmrAB and yxaGH operons
VTLAAPPTSMTVVIGFGDHNTRDDSCHRYGYDRAMDSTNESTVVTSDRRRSPARARMVRSAAMLMRERGIHGVGLREVVTHSGGPRGSLGRYFPGGKTQLMTEAIDVVLAALFDEVDRALAEAESFPEAIGVIVTPWRRLLVDHDFALGCPLAATIVDAADNDDLRGHASDLLARWQESVAQVYVRFGDPPAVADEQSTVLLASLEGALILARARRTTEPLDTVERYFASRAPDASRERT